MSIKFYSDYNLQVVNDNLDTIEDAATRAGYIRMEPHQDEYNMIKQLILDYIIQNKRIVYGGSAYHAIIQKHRSDKSSDNKIYQEWARYDIEFYSPDPVKDMVKICNKLNSAKVKHVMGRQAQHDENGDRGEHLVGHGAQVGGERLDGYALVPLRPDQDHLVAVVGRALADVGHHRVHGDGADHGAAAPPAAGR